MTCPTLFLTGRDDADRGSRQGGGELRSAARDVGRAAEARGGHAGPGQSMFVYSLYCYLVTHLFFSIT